MNHFITAMKKFATFSGRARRAEYWYFFLFNLLITYGLMGLGVGLEIPAFAMAGTLVSLVLLIPGIAVTIRRMHDVGKSGWFCLIPIYNLILTLTPGETGPNKYGPDPKNPNAGDDIMEHLVEN